MKFESWELLLSAGMGFLATGLYQLINKNYTPSLFFLLAGILTFVASRKKYNKFGVK